MYIQISFLNPSCWLEMNINKHQINGHTCAPFQNQTIVFGIKMSDLALNWPIKNRKHPVFECWLCMLKKYPKTSLDFGVYKNGLCL
jgi:hypothetical protein